MAKYLKHDDAKPGPRKTTSKKSSAPVSGESAQQLGEIAKAIRSRGHGEEYALQDLAEAVSRYVKNATLDSGGTGMQIFTGPSGSGYHPVLIALERSDSLDDLIAASERIATAFERIAAALEAQPKGQQ